MTIQEIINMAKGSELRNLKVDDASVLSYINLAMIELYKRFPISTAEGQIEKVMGQDVYDIPAEWGYMWIIGAWGTIIVDNRLEPAQLRINEEDSPYSLNTFSWNKVQINEGVADGIVSIIYVKAPTMYGEADMASHIAVPPQFTEALLHYIGYRAYSTLDDIGEQGGSNAHYARFEASCNRIKMEGMYNSDDMDLSARLFSRGFV